MVAALASHLVDSLVLLVSVSNIMAAPMHVSRQICSLSRIFAGISTLGTTCLNNCGGHQRCISRRYRPHLPLSLTASFHSGIASLSAPSITVTEEPDTLFQKVSVLVKGHDRAVLDSYEFFATLATKELGLTLSNVSEPPKDIERFTLLKSPHIFKKHRVQYEMRTHFRCIELSHLTGSTAQVYLEYIQRNLPEGVAMEVTKTVMEKIPEHILEPMWKDKPTDKSSSQSEQS